MKGLDAITTVYSYYPPEIRRLIDDLTRSFPHEVFLRSITPGLDDFHQPIIDRLVHVHRDDVPNLGDFAHRYPTSGSEEGIREYLTLLATQGVKRINVWKGDYEGYREVAKTRGIDTHEVDFDADPATVPIAPWFLSNPSARDGNLVDPAKIAAVLEAGHPLFYDLAYLGTTDPATFDISHPNIRAVAVSFSKPYGLFYYRVGFLFTREIVPALYANKWFKNVFGLLIADRLMQEIDLTGFAAKYKTIQRTIVSDAVKSTGLPLKASDGFLLMHCPAASIANFPEEIRSELTKFRRGDGYRFCLTPAFMAAES